MKKTFVYALIAAALLQTSLLAQSTPFGGKPARIPGTIKAENFDEGPEGVAFHNVEPVMDPDAKTGPRALGLAYRKTPVELEEGWGSMMLAAVREGEWYSYTVQVDHEGLYDAEFVVAGWKDGDMAGSFRIDFDGVDKTGLIPVPNTQKWYLFKTITKTGIALKKGTYLMKVTNVKGSDAINLASFRFNPTFPLPAYVPPKK